MLKKFLNKKMSPFLDQAFPENILPHLRIRNKTKKLLNKRKTARAQPKLQGTAFKSKKHGVKKIEGQVVKQFSKNKFVSAISSTQTGSLLLENPSKAGSDFLNQNFTLPENVASTSSNILSELSCNENFIKSTPSTQGKFGVSLTSNSKGDGKVPAHFLFSLHQLRNEISRKQGSAKKYSEFKMQLRERRKLSVFFGNVCKRDLRRAINKLDSFRGKANENLLALLETRLDVALQRCFFFATILSARQSVNHGKISVNGKIVTLPSYQLRPGDIICVSKNPSSYTAMLCKSQHSVPSKAGLDFSSVENFVKSNQDEKSNASSADLTQGAVLRRENKNKKFIDTTSLIKNLKNAGILRSLKLYSKNTTDWRFLVSPFLMQFLAKIQFILTFTQDKIKKSGLVFQSKNGDASFLAENQSKKCDDSQSSKNLNPVLFSMAKLPCSAFQGANISFIENFVKLNPENIKMEASAKAYSSLFDKYANFAIEQFTQKVLNNTTKIIKTKIGIQPFALQSKLSFFFKNTKFYNFFFYLLIKRYLSHNEHRKDSKARYFQTASSGSKYMKTLHFEVSHKSLTAIFLYPPQKLYFPATFDLDLIRKSFK